MSFRLPFTLRETWGGLKHIRLKYERELMRQPVDLHLKRAMDKGFACTAAGAGGEVDVCHVCGFAMAEFVLPEGWTFQTCSAQGIRPHFKSPEFQQWSRRLAAGSEHCTDREDSKSAKVVPGSNV